MGLSRVQIIDQDPCSVQLFYRDLSDVGFLIFQPAFWGRDLPCRYSGNCLGRVSMSPARGDGMGSL